MNQRLLDTVTAIRSANNNPDSTDFWQIIRNYQCSEISTDYVALFGDASDGVIEYIGRTQIIGGLFEVGYYYGNADAKPKYIVNVSPQIGCPAGCKFCELGNLRFVRNQTPAEVFEQVMLMLQIALRNGVDLTSKRHKINIAKSGDILLNALAKEILSTLDAFGFSLKVSTVFPRSPRAMQTFREITEYAASNNWRSLENAARSVQIQISLISTSAAERDKLSGGAAAPFQSIRSAADYWFKLQPNARKINLSLILSETSQANVNSVKAIFPPVMFNFRFRPYIPTTNGQNNHLQQIALQRLEQIKSEFTEAGYTVGDWATPTATETRFSLSSNSTLARYIQQVGKGQLKE